MIDGLVESALNIYCPAEQYSEEWDIKGLAEIMHGQFGLDIAQGKSDGGEALRAIGRDALLEDLRTQVREAYDRREQDLSPDLMRFLEKTFMLQVIDHHWKDHLLGMDHLRDGIGLRGYGQKDPLIEYKREGFDLFAGMMERVKSDTLDRLFHVQAVRNEEQQAATPHPRRPLSSHAPNPRSSSIAEKNQSHLRLFSEATRKWAATTPAPAAAGKNTRSATERREVRCASLSPPRQFDRSNLTTAWCRNSGDACTTHRHHASSLASAYSSPSGTIGVVVSRNALILLASERIVNGFCTNAPPGSIKPSAVAQASV